MTKEQGYIIGIDIGTQSLRTGIFKIDGKCISLASYSYPTHYEKVNWATQDPLEWWSAFKKGLKKCFYEIEKNNIIFDKLKIKAISVCATSSTIIPVNKEGEPLTDALLWMDKRAYQEAEEINNKKHDILRYCGGKVSAEWMVPKMLWLKKNAPTIYNRADYIIEALDWFNYQLTGKWVVSKCNATCKWNYTDIEGGWSKDFFQQIGLEDFQDYWPERVIAVGKIIGKLSKKAVGELDLHAGIDVIQGGIDAHIALLGMGVTTTEKLGIIMGSSFVHLAFSKQPVFNSGLWGPYSNALIENSWIIEGGQTSGGSINRWFKDNFAQELINSEENPYAILSKEASLIKPGSEGLVILDFWQGNRTPYRDPLASGNIFGLKLRHTRGHIYRALLESIAYGTQNILKTIESTGYKINDIVVCGGGVKDELWLQIISDVTGIQLNTTKFNEAGIMGCAIVAAYGSGYYGSIQEAAEHMVEVNKVIQPDNKNHTIYNYYFKKYLQLYKNLAPLMHEVCNKVIINN